MSIVSFFQDMLAVFKKRELPLIKNYKESEDVYTFLFKKEEDLTWKAGQHGLFTITHRKIKNATRPFSIASSPTENVVRITMKINDNPSEFKKAMLELKKGMIITMSGPVGPFHLKDSSPTILIAGGIGITPFRSILKQIQSDGSLIEKPIHLLYLDSNNPYLFKEELDEIANNTSLTVTYLDSKDSLPQEINKYVNLYKNDGKYFVAGPKLMVETVIGYLQSHNISKRNIKKDSFFGY
jgi:ferredoxin-NADP reductase